MQPADFTIEFYRKCLSQAKWRSQDERDIESFELLDKVAHERGGDFRTEFYNWLSTHREPENLFPVADKTATENPQQKTNTKPNTPMKALLTEIYDALIKPLIDAIDRNTAANTGGQIVTPAATVTPCEAPPKEDEDKPEPKKRKSKTAETPAPEPTVAPEPEPTPVVEEEPYMSGSELVELMKPLSGTKYTKILVEFRNTTLGFEKMTREMSDPTMLRQMEAKVRECLAANEEDQKEV